MSWENQFLKFDFGFFSAQFHFSSYTNPALFPTFFVKMKELSAWQWVFIGSREGGLREFWGVTERCWEVQWECSRNVQALQSYVHG